ncbi:MAG: twin-arginine translocation signal domain-containing protein, partial [Planctomycetota bacterium]
MISGSYSRRDFLRRAGLGAAAVALSGCVGGESGRAGRPAVNRPNILILMTDQQRYDSLSC